MKDELALAAYETVGLPCLLIILYIISKIINLIKEINIEERRFSDVTTVLPLIILFFTIIANFRTIVDLWVKFISNLKW